LTVLKPITPITPITAVQDRHSETVKCQREMRDNKLNSVERGSVTKTVTGIKEAGHTEKQPPLCHVAEGAAVITG
jgi:hypothetical protein